MRPVIKRLEQLESARRTLLADKNPSGAKVMLIDRINRLAERSRASGDWPSWPIPRVEEAQILLGATLDRFEKRA
jgi:hypothetical protein